MKKYNYRNIIFLMAVGILFIIIFLKYNIGIPCFFYKITGFYCPGCGGTRAIVSLIKLKPYQAFRYNALIIILIPFAAIDLFYKVILKGKKKISNVIWTILLVLTIVFGILRNITIFSYLAPTIILNAK